jgi:tRNA uridine 5-carboxymethylaminomethyl modification enzyme
MKYWKTSSAVSASESNAMSREESFDIIVVGAGHAGCEAAVAASRMGFKTCLITINLETIAQMSCNPAIGGLAKGHLVREIDALGGVMGRLADQTGIHFRLLNRSRGGAVQAPRAQSDKALYRSKMKSLLENTPNLTLFQGIVTELQTKNRKIAGINTLEGNRLQAKAVILSPGTFLNGRIHIGSHCYPAGRANEPPSEHLSEYLAGLGLKLFRLKTGTPMRLHRDSIAWDRFAPQPGDDSPVPFSFRTKEVLENKITCHMGYTNTDTHKIIERDLQKSALYGGRITGIGPRYCPSIEVKVVQFPHHKRHQFFLEPEGLDTAEVYINGISSSLPLETQREVLASIPGLDQAEILRPAYAIEYDAVLPTQLLPTLETQNLANLYLAGQINGTSGYEEAAAQGLIAGINAALKLKGQDPFVLGRDQAYVGVLIDDLISKGVEEPYRLFTSRAEYRLQLRIDNADHRLMGYGHDLGLIDEEAYENFQEKQRKIRKVLGLLEKTRIRQEGKEPISLKALLKKPHVTYPQVLAELTTKIDPASRAKSNSDIVSPPGTEMDPDVKSSLDMKPSSETTSSHGAKTPPEIDSSPDKSASPGIDLIDAIKLSEEEIRHLESEIKYEGYLKRQAKEIAQIKKIDREKIPVGMDFHKVAGLTAEVIERLEKSRPATLGEAKKIPGLTPAAVINLHIHIKLLRKSKKTRSDQH